MKTAIVFGTRPEIIKCAPIVRAFQASGMEFVSIDTGQHHAPEMADQIYAAMGYRPMIVAAAAFEFDQIVGRIREVLLRESATTVLVLGDTDSTFAAAVAARSLGIRLAHAEAGLRSRDYSMKEERNRVAVDHMAGYLFAPTEEAALTLYREHVRGDVQVTGNTIVDALRMVAKSARDPQWGSYILLTLHRRENVDDPRRLRRILDVIAAAAAYLALPVYFPIHPRTLDQIGRNAIEVPKIIVSMTPVDYLSFVGMERSASLIMTDSGGIQEEACILGVPCVTLRDTTERPETLWMGANVLMGMVPDFESMRDAAEMMIWRRSKTWIHPYGDGHAGEKIAEAVLEMEAAIV